MVKNQWSRWRVHKIIPNKDGKVRCLEIRKSDGSVLLRDVRNICKLEVDLNEQVYVIFLVTSLFISSLQL